MRSIIWILLLALGPSAWAADDKAAKEEQAPPPAKSALELRVEKFYAEYSTPEKIAARFKEWTVAEPQNPEPYVMAANAYVRCSSQVVISADPNAGNVATLVDPKTQKPAGSLGTELDPQTLGKALDILTTATTKFPQRLDIHLGRMAVAQLLKSVPKVLQAGVDLVKAVAAHPDQIRGGEGETFEEGAKARAAGEIQSYIAWFYGQKNDEGDKAGLDLATEGLKLAPEDTKLLNDVAVYYAYKEKWETALEYFLKAAKADPQDFQVQNNIAMIEVKLGRQDEARQIWLNILARYGETSPAGKQATEYLKNLGK